MGQLSVVAQNAMDLYYQTYKSEEDFFQFYHFNYLVSISYAAFLQAEYEKSYAKNLAENGIGEATLNPEWFISENIDIKRSEEIAPFYAKLKHRPFQFKFDKQSSAIMDIIAANGKCKDFIRMNINERYKLKLLPPSPEIYWYPLFDKLYFSMIHCGLSKAVALYIPNVDCEDENAVIPQAMEGDVISATLNLMLQAKQGTPVVDVTSDGNPNKNLQTEINNLFTKLRGRQ